MNIFKSRNQDERLWNGLRIYRCCKGFVKNEKGLDYLEIVKKQGI